MNDMDAWAWMVTAIAAVLVCAGAMSLGVLLVRLLSPTYRRRADCWHHDRLTGTSWIKGQIIDPGKMFWCTRCQKTWMV